MSALRRFWRSDDLYAPLPWWAGTLIGHLDAERRPMPQGVGWPAVHRKKFDDATIDAAWLTANGRMVFGAYSFDNCTFVLCTFQDLDDVVLRFSRCRFVDCNFSGHADGNAGSMSAVFDVCELRGRVEVPGILVHRNHGNFTRIRLVDSVFVHCFLDRIDFGQEVEFDRVRMRAVQGLPRCTGLAQVQVTDRGRDLLNGDLAGAPIGLLDRFASWERLRTLGRLPLFGTSVTALVAIPVLFYGLAVYNDQLDRLQHWALRDGFDRRLSDGLLAIDPLPLPALSFWLLISTFLLGAASLIFALACPPRVREFSLERWTDELRQSALRYLPLSWQSRWARAVAAPCYVIGGGGTLVILMIKLWNAGAFILANATPPY